MVKSIIAVLIILAAGGGWFYMDYLNKQEQAAAAEMRKEVEHSRALAAAAEKARAEAKATFNAQLETDLTACKLAAEKASTEYITTNQKPVPRKPGLFTIPAGVAEAAAKILEEENAKCQNTHDSRFASSI
jgi:hypothetical protein